MLVATSVGFSVVFETTEAAPSRADTRIAKSAIRWEVTPPSVVVYLDGKKLGRAGDLKATPTTPGRHAIRLVNGKDETELEIEVGEGQIVRFVLDFSE